MLCYLCRSQTKQYKVVSGCALIKGGRGEFEVHPGDEVVVPGSPTYTIVNSGSDTLHLEPVEQDKPVFMNHS